MLLLLLEELSGVPAKNNINPSMALQLLPNYGLWIFTCHIKLQQLQGKEELTWLLAVTPPLTTVSCPKSALCSQRLKRPWLHLSAPECKLYYICF